MRRKYIDDFSGKYGLILQILAIITWVVGGLTFFEALVVLFIIKFLERVDVIIDYKRLVEKRARDFNKV